EVINDFSKVDSIVFDKTGTLTIGNPEVAESKLYGDADKALSYLARIEKESDHNLGKAIITELRDIELYPVEDTDVVKGGGIITQVDGHRVAVGNVELMEKESVQLSDKDRADIHEYEQDGTYLVLTAVDCLLKAEDGIRDQVRKGVKNDLQKLKDLGVKNLIVLSGDNQGTVDLVANELGLTEAHGHMLPEDKSAYIEKLQAEGQIVAFVGDGVND